MKSKNYILSQIRELLIERHAYTPERAERYVELHKEDKVYELLVLKKSLSSQKVKMGRHLMGLIMKVVTHNRL